MIPDRYSSLKDSGMKDYYQLLGVEMDSTAQQIKKAYRNKVKELHPDVNGNGDSLLFEDIKEAYDCLSDKKKRMEYDLSILLAGGRTSVQDETDDIRCSVNINLSRTLSPAKASVHVLRRARTDYGFIMEDSTEILDIPPGTREGDVIRLKGKGHAHEDKSGCGDLEVTVHIVNDTSFTRIGDYDLGIAVAFTYPQIVLGCRVQIPTLDGRTAGMVIPPSGAQVGGTIKIPGKGCVKPDGITRGDLYVKVMLKPLGNVNEYQKELLNELQATGLGLPELQDYL